MKKKTIVSLALASTLLLSSAPAFADEISDLQSKREVHEKSKTELETKLDGVKKNISSVETKIQKLDVDITKNLNDIGSTQDKIKAVQKEIKRTEKKIEQTEEELDKKKEILAENLRIMYSKGTVSYIEFLFRSESVSDFLYRFTNMEDVAEANERLYQEIKDLLAELEDNKKELESKEKTLADKKEELDKLKSSLASRQSEQLENMKQLESQEKHLHDEINEKEAAIAVVNGQIGEVIRKREEARQRALAEQRRKQQQQQNQHQNQNKPSQNTQKPTPPTGGFGNEISSSGQMMFPVKSGTYFISSPYGWRTHPITGVKKYHSGIDFAAPLGTPIYATDNGTVLFAGPANGYGNWVVIDHNNGLYSIFGHMYANQIYVSPGQTVTKGQHLADIGSAGQSTGAHLHYSLADSFNGSTFNYVDPMNYLK